MPRKKREPVVEKTPLELALEESPEPEKPKRTQKSKTKNVNAEVEKTTAPNGNPVRRPKRQKIEEVPKQEFPRYTPPKMKFSRKRIRYSEGDTVEISEAEGKFVGVLRSILSSQLVVEDDKGNYRWFFQSGIQIRRLKKGAQRH